MFDCFIANTHAPIQYDSEVVIKNSSHSWPSSKIVNFSNSFCHLQWMCWISVFVLGLLDFGGESEETPFRSAIELVVTSVVSRLHMVVGGFNSEP